MHLVTTIALSVLAFAVLISLLALWRRPAFTLRFGARRLVGLLYRFQKTGLEHIPEHGAAVLVSNHVSFVDAIAILAASPRPVRFVMDHRIHAIPLLNPVLRLARTIPIAPAHEDRRTLERAFDAIAAALENGELVCVFPEGRLTRNGELGEFKRGIEKIVERNPVVVVPMALHGFWGSVFSRSGGPVLRRALSRFRSRVILNAGSPLSPAEVTRYRLAHRVQELHDFSEPRRV